MVHGSIEALRLRMVRVGMRELLGGEEEGKGEKRI